MPSMLPTCSLHRRQAPRLDVGLADARSRRHTDIARTSAPVFLSSRRRSRRLDPRRFHAALDYHGACAPEAAPADARTLTYTSYEGNSWSMEFPKSGVNVLVDPWLVGDLTFAGQDWLYKGTKTVEMPSLKDVELCTDFILISQGLDDHAHIPTLKQLSKHLPVVASPSAAAVCRDLGFTNVRSLDAGERCTLCDGKIGVRATEGALVGPPWSKREAGFVIKERMHEGVSVYYEPHCDFVDSSIRPFAPVDVVVSPVVSVDLGGFPLVKGHSNILRLVEALRPSVVVALMNGTFTSEGPLSAGMGSKGTVEELPLKLRENGYGDVKMAIPQPGTPLLIRV